MTDLHRRALARLPLTEAEVERLYASFRAGPDDVSVWAHMRAHMRQVLESHERQRLDAFVEEWWQGVGVRGFEPDFSRCVLLPAVPAG